jgi:outer membrane protein OmpA-like peptidoglycan-associated protein
MSWTSEHDPPSGSATGADGSGLDARPADTADGDGDDPLDDGPLDPSVFDGLFDDLTRGSGVGPPPEPVDNPLDEFLASPLAGPLDHLDVIEPSDRTRAEDRATPSPLEPPVGTEPIGIEPPIDIEPSIGTEPPIDIEPSIGTEPIGIEPIGIEPPTEPIPSGWLTGPGHPLAESPPAHDPVTDGLVNPSWPAPDPLLAGPTDDVPADDRVDHDLTFFDVPADDHADHDVPDHDLTFFDVPAPDISDHDIPVFDVPTNDLPPVFDVPTNDLPVFDVPDPHVSDHDLVDHDLVDVHGYDAAQTAAHPATDHDHPDRNPAADHDLPDDHGYHTDRGHHLEDPGTDDGTAGLRLSSPPIQHDPEPAPGFAPFAEATVGHAERPTEVAPDEIRPRSRSRATTLVLAVVIGSAIGIGGAVALGRLVGGDETEAAGPATAELGDEERSPAGPVATPTASAVTSADDGLEVASLHLTPGTEPPSLADNPALQLVAEAIQRTPSAPISATVRTFTEATAADDLALSLRQAEAIEAQLVALGAQPERVSVTGLGRSLLSPAQPVPNFVVASAGLDDSPVADAARGIGPFAIGIDRATGQLRPEARLALTELAQAMVDDPEQHGVTLAAYSFDRPTGEANDQQAASAATAAADYLVAVGIDPARITTIVVGDQPFAVTDQVANHIDLRWGDSARPGVTLGDLAVDRVDFLRGAAQLAGDGDAVITALGALIVESGSDAVIDVHSYDGSGPSASVDLSVVRAQAIGQRLVELGVPVERLHLHGGASPQFRSEDRTGRIVVTLLPPNGA